MTHLFAFVQRVSISIYYTFSKQQHNTGEMKQKRNLTVLLFVSAKAPSLLLNRQSAEEFKKANREGILGSGSNWDGYDLSTVSLLKSVTHPSSIHL